MDQKNSWKKLFDKELKQAEAARAAKNEGKARVCARRAAGIAIGEYLSRQGIPLNNPSSYDRLKYLITMPNLPTEIKQPAQYLILRVNQDHELPVDVDLIAEARKLMRILFLKEPKRD